MRNFISFIVTSLFACTLMLWIKGGSSNDLRFLEYRNEYIRSITRNSVVLIHVYKKDGTGSSGTGFHVDTKKGQVILTNKHICADGVAKGSRIVAIKDSKEVFLTFIVKMSPATDLCALLPFPDSTSLPLADDVATGTVISVVGHPEGMATHVSDGKYIDLHMDFDAFPVDLMGAKACISHKGYIAKGSCIQEYPVMITSAEVLGGNSGSPIIDIDGKVLGIIHKRSASNWGVGVSLVDISEFLKGL